jgi:hypothetical protein
VGYDPVLTTELVVGYDPSLTTEFIVVYDPVLTTELIVGYDPVLTTEFIVGYPDPVPSTSQYTSLRYILRISSYLLLGLPYGHFSKGSPTKILQAFLVSLILPTWTPHRKSPTLHYPNATVWPM